MCVCVCVCIYIYVCIRTTFTTDSLNFPKSNFLIFFPNVEFTYGTSTRCMQLK